MAYQNSGNTVIDDSRNFTFSNVTIQNNGFLEITSSDAFQGTVAGYLAGGYAPGESPAPATTTIIQKFPFATDTNSTDVGDLTQRRGSLSGQSSTTHGYASGGSVPPSRVNTIDKFPFATDTNAVKIGNNTTVRRRVGGNSSSTNGYLSGGDAFGAVNNIDKFPFSNDTNGADVGDLSQARMTGSTQSSSVSGYVSGGYLSTPTPTTNVIDKFPFATDTNASDVGDLEQSRNDRATGQSSTTHGYVSGGSISPVNPVVEVNTIEKFPFATDTNATDIADLTQARIGSAGQSSTLSGYTSGGGTPTFSNVIDKFPFAADSNATDVGDLYISQSFTAGQQD